MKLKQILGIFLVLFSFFGTAAGVCQTEGFPGRVIDIRSERGQATLRFPPGSSLEAGATGLIQSNRGPVDFRVVNLPNESEATVREERRGSFTDVRIGDRALLYPTRKTILEKTSESLDRIDALIEERASADTNVPSSAPDLLAEVTDEVLLDYEAWLMLLESETVVPELPIELEEIDETKPSIYPDLEVRQTLRTGVDYDQFVFHATGEEHAPRETRRQIGRYLRWNYVELGDLDPQRNLFFENELEANQDFLYEEMDFTVKKDLPNGDRMWWDNRSIWKAFNNNQGDSFIQNDLEVRHVRKLSKEWEWQRGFELDFRHEYEAEQDDGYLRGTFISEWNYREGFDKWVDIAYEFTREVRNDPENRSQEYWEHRLLTHVFSLRDEVSFDFDGDFYYRDYNQPGSDEDEFISVWTATCRKSVSDEFSKGWRLTMEPHLYPTTEDLNSNALSAELARLYEYTSGTELYVTVEPRFGQVFHFGEVPADIPLDPRLPRDKSDGDYREAGMNLSVSWFPNEQWRINLFEDVYHRWFPAGETGVTAFYLFDFPRIADFTGTYSSLSIDYIPEEDLEFSLNVSHSKQFYDTFKENDSSSFNIGLEATYRF